MKRQQKIIFLPFILVITLLVVSFIGAEHHLKTTIDHQIDEQLKAQANGLLSGFSVANNSSFSPQIVFSKLIEYAKPDNQYWITATNSAGVRLADSNVNDNAIAQRSLLSLPEFHDALTQGEVTMSRYDQEAQQNYIFFVKYDAQLDVIVRVGVSEEYYQQLVSQLRTHYLQISVVAILAISLLGFVAARLLKEQLKKERRRQQQLVSSRTHEITLVQTMTTMLNAADNLEDAGIVVANILPKLLPLTSGTLFIVEENEETVELAQWGEDYQRTNVTQLKQGFNALTDKSNCENDGRSPCSWVDHDTCIKLFDRERLIGVLHIVDNAATKLPQPMYDIANQLSEHLSYALANLLVKRALKVQAIRDPLTNLYNRRFMMEALDQALNRAERHHHSLAVLMIDLDNFKQFNDKFGHEAGDLVLTSVANLFKDNLRLEDHACRYGGEEFCVLCPDTGLRDAFVLAEKLRGSVSELNLSLSGKDLGQTTISIGVALYPNHANNSHEVLMQADKALYAAKNRGRNITVVAQAHSQYYETIS